MLNCVSKLCLKCGKEKPIEMFCKNKRKKDGLDIYCNECKKNISQLPENKEKSHKYQVEYYQKHRRQKIEYATKHQRDNSVVHSIYNQRSRNKKKKFLDSVKTACANCGEDRIWCIDFHHIDPSTKNFNINNTRHGWDEIKIELGKVICLCANCHREFHAFYGTKPKEPVQALSEYLDSDPHLWSIKVEEELCDD